MAESDTERISFTAFGVAIELSLPARLHERALGLLPPGATAQRGDRAHEVVSIEPDGEHLTIIAAGERVGRTDDEELALGMLDAQIRARLALLAPEQIFVHAGVVAVGDRAVVMPAFTRSGKTTLTRGLLEAGAVYYSDEFAVIDAAGLVHPYPKPLSIRHRDGSGRTTETPAAALGARTGQAPVPVGLVALTAYRPGAALEPQPLTRGAALLALLSHTIPARTRPRQSLAVLKAAVRDAAAWRSDRGEAGEAARAIIAQLS